MDDKDFLLEAYKKANEHLFQTDKNRDQLLVFYTTIVGAYVAFLSFGSSSSQSGTEVQIFMVSTGIPIAVSILSVAVGWILILYRRWHTFYVEMVKLLAEKLFSEQARNEILNSWEVAQEKKLLFPSGGIYSVESMFFNAFLFVSFPTIYVVIRPIISVSSIDEVYVYLALNSIYFFIGNLLSNYFQGMRFKGPWMFANLVVDRK